MVWVYTGMNYKQCLEFLELNTENKDLTDSQLSDLYAQLQIQRREDEKVICTEESMAGYMQMTYLEKAFVNAGIRCMFFSRKALGDYRDRWRVGGRMISQKMLCEAVEQIAACAEQIPSTYQMELLISEMVFARSDAKVFLLQKADADKRAWWQEESVAKDLDAIREPSYKMVKKNLKRQIVEIGDYKNIQLGTLGHEAVAGAYRALELLPCLRANGIALEDHHLRKAFEETYLTPAFGKLHTKPLMFVDEMITRRQAERLVQDIEVYLPDRPVVLIWGATKETQIGEVLRVWSKKASYILTVAPPGKNRIPAYELAQEVLAETSNVTAVDSLEEAYEIIKMILPMDGVVLVAGCQELLLKWIKLMEEKKS